MQVCGFAVSLHCLIIRSGRCYGSSTNTEGHFFMLVCF
nr:MAG TPA: hypothetical protein [Caudoviricetes sp.]